MMNTTAKVMNEIVNTKYGMTDIMNVTVKMMKTINCKNNEWNHKGE